MSEGQQLGEVNPDPLLAGGCFIDAETKESPVMATPVSQRRASKKSVQDKESTDSPSWLPQGWRMDVRVRTSGATAGTADRYFMSPTGQRFRSKVEVLHFLETGSKRKGGTGKMKSDADAQSSESAADKKKKKQKSNVEDFSDLKFDFKNPPAQVTWVRGDDNADEWIPTTGNSNTHVPAALRREWAKAYSRVTQLEAKRQEREGSP